MLSIGLKLLAISSLYHVIVVFIWKSLLDKHDCQFGLFLTSLIEVCESL